MWISMKYSNSIKLSSWRNLLQLTLKCTVNWRMHQDSCLTTTEFHSAVKHKSVSEIIKDKFPSPLQAESIPQSSVWSHQLERISAGHGPVQTSRSILPFHWYYEENRSHPHQTLDDGSLQVELMESAEGGKVEDELWGSVSCHSVRLSPLCCCWMGLWNYLLMFLVEQTLVSVDLNGRKIETFHCLWKCWIHDHCHWYDESCFLDSSDQNKILRCSMDLAWLWCWIYPFSCLKWSNHHYC